MFSMKVFSGVDCALVACLVSAAKTVKEGRVCLASSIAGTIHHGRECMTAGGGGRSRHIHRPEAER